MDRKKSFLNVFVSIAFKIILLFTSLFSRRFLIQYIGNDVNGLNSLYSSIIGFLSVAELGVGTAITYCMYKPIVNGEKEKVCALYNLFKKIYLFIGLIIFFAGLITAIFLPYLASDYSSLNVNVYLTFILALLATVITYFYNSQVSLINAYKDNYLTNAISSSCRVLRDALQIAVIILFKSFILYLLCSVLTTLIDWVITNIFCRKKHGDLMYTQYKIDSETKKEVTKNIGAMFAHKIGGALVNTADSVIISAFIGVVTLGGYSNYTVIMSSMVGVISLFFTPLTSIIGHMCAENKVDKEERYFQSFYTLNFIIGVLFFLGYFSIIDDLICLFFGENLIMSKSISIIITINQFVQFLRQAVLTFRDATGTYYYDRWKPIIEGVINVFLSILFVIVFPDEYKVVGVIVATIITNLMICHIIDPLVLYKYEFRKSVKSYYLKNYSCILLFCIMLFLLNFCMLSFENRFVELLVNGFISVAFSFAVFLFTFVFDRNFRFFLKRLFVKTKKTKLR